jgi:hypothetical protein
MAQAMRGLVASAQAVDAALGEDTRNSSDLEAAPLAVGPTFSRPKAYAVTSSRNA